MSQNLKTAVILYTRYCVSISCNCISCLWTWGSTFFGCRWKGIQTLQTDFLHLSTLSEPMFFLGYTEAAISYSQIIPLPLIFPFWFNFFELAIHHERKWWADDDFGANTGTKSCHWPLSLFPLQQQPTETSEVQHEKGCYMSLAA